MWESRYQDLKKANKEDRNILEKITKCGISSNSDNSYEAIIHIRFDVSDFSMELLDNFVSKIIDGLNIKGIDKINDVFGPSTELYDEIITDDGKINTFNEYAIETSGINMERIRYIEGIDALRTMCNDLHQVYELFGIEAARIALLREITKVFNRSGKAVNFQHLSLISDLMSREGYLISIDRHGMGRTDAAPLGKVSFEKPVEQLLTAAVFNEKDPLKGVSGRIMTGNVIKGGTGLCDLILDYDMVERSEYIDDDKDKTKILDDTEVQMMNDVISNEDDGMFIPNI